MRENKFFRHIEFDSLQPKRFKLCDDEPWRSKGVRCFNVKNYMVFYLPNESDKTVTILSVMYGGRNIQEQLKEIEI